MEETVCLDLVILKFKQMIYFFYDVILSLPIASAYHRRSIHHLSSEEIKHKIYFSILTPFFPVCTFFF